MEKANNWSQREALPEMPLLDRHITEAGFDLKTEYMIVNGILVYCPYLAEGVFLKDKIAIDRNHRMYKINAYNNCYLVTFLQNPEELYMRITD